MKSTFNLMMISHQNNVLAAVATQFAIGTKSVLFLRGIVFAFTVTRVYPNYIFKVFPVFIQCFFK